MTGQVHEGDNWKHAATRDSELAVPLVQRVFRSVSARVLHSFCIAAAAAPIRCLQPTLTGWGNQLGGMTAL